MNPSINLSHSDRKKKVRGILNLNGLILKKNLETISHYKKTCNLYRLKTHVNHEKPTHMRGANRGERSHDKVFHAKVRCEGLSSHKLVGTRPTQKWQEVARPRPTQE